MFNRVLSVLFAMLWTVSALAQHATYVVDGSQEKEQYRSHTILEAIEAESNVVHALNGVEFYMNGVKMNKTSGGTLDRDRRNTGSNSAFLATSGSQVYMESCNVTSHVVNADGVTALDDGTTVKIVGGTFRTSRNASASVNSSNGASIVIEEADIMTSGGQSPAMFTGNDGVLEIVKSKGGTTDTASPLFLSHGKITARECRMTTDMWTLGQVDGGELVLEKNELQSRSFCGVMAYGADKSRSSGVINLSHNEITVTEGPLFYVTNADARIIVSDHNKFSSKEDLVLVAKSDDWGVKGDNGGNAVLVVENQSLNGDIVVDSISSVVLDMQKKSSLTGAINSKANPVATVRVKLSKGAVWKVNKDSYLTSVEFSEPLAKGLKQIKGRHTVYYDPNDPANALLMGHKHKISGGGSLCPIK